MFRLLKNDSGDAKIVAVVSVLAVAFLIKFKQNFSSYGIHLTEFQYNGIIASLIIVSVLSLLYSLHMTLMGAKPNKQLLQEIQAKINESEKLLVESNARLREYEEDSAQLLKTLSRKVPERLSMARKIIRALERRVNEAKGLISSRSGYELMKAYDLMQDKLSIGGSPLDALIEVDPMPPLEPFELAPTLHRLFDYVETDLKKAVQVQAQLRRVA